MTEELNTPTVDVLETVEAPVEATDGPQLSKHEQAAIAKGWKPRDQFVGDEEDFVDAREFLRGAELRDHIHKLNRKMKDQQKALDYMLDHNKKIQETAYQKAMTDLIAQQKHAASMGDVGTVEHLTNEIVKMKTEHSVQPDVTTLANKAATAFIERNKSWYAEQSAEGRAMQAFAQAKADEISLARPDLDPEEVFSATEDEVKKMFSHRFRTTRDTVSPVLAPGIKPVKADGVNFESLPKEIQKDIQLMQRHAKNFDINKYVADLKMIGYLK